MSLAWLRANMRAGGGYHEAQVTICSIQRLFPGLPPISPINIFSRPQVSGGWDKTVLVWDLRVGRAVRSIHGPYICGEAVDVSGSTLLTGSWRREAPLQVQFECQVCLNGLLLNLKDRGASRTSPAANRVKHRLFHLRCIQLPEAARFHSPPRHVNVEKM